MLAKVNNAVSALSIALVRNQAGQDVDLSVEAARAGVVLADVAAMLRELDNLLDDALNTATDKLAVTDDEHEEVLWRAVAATAASTAAITGLGFGDARETLQSYDIDVWF